ncbi:MAG: CHAT domain-containing protein, partial [Planctomycetes bacterium]|nr:CHAT domain-containing protein [Planctomycetota bacterium]
HALELARARGALDVAVGGGSSVAAEELARLATRRLLSDDAAEIEALAAELDALRAHHASAARPAIVPDAGELRAFAARHAEVTMLSWWLGRDEAWLLVVRAGEVEQFALDAPGRCRAHAAAAFRAVMSPQGDGRDLVAAADCLLPGAVRPLLGETVLAVLDPTMARLPLAALVVDGRPFGASHRLVQSPSIAVARAVGDRTPGTGRALVVQAPERSELADHLGLDPLRFAARECAAVVAAHAGAALIAGEQATLAELRRSVQQAAIEHGAAPSTLHVAAHAVDCPGLPTQSLLLLADGPVAMGGLAELRLPGALVVLSACAAATGEQRGREGVIGLVEGMFAAGARAVVAPVAAVNQQATADLMRLFHDQLSRGVDPASALQHARQAMAATANYGHPHYWGAFTVFGGLDPAVGPVVVERRSRWPLWVGVGALIALGVWLLLPRQQREVGLR